MPQVPLPSRIVDLSNDVTRVAEMGTSLEQVDELLGDSLETLGQLVPFDLATIMDLHGDELRVRVARGPLAGDKVESHRLALADFPAIRELLQANKPRAFTESDHRDGDGDAFDGVLDLPHGHACMVVPLSVRSNVMGIMTFDRGTCGPYSQAVVDLAGVFGKLLAMSISYGEQSTVLARLGEQLREQNRLLRERGDSKTDACALMKASRSPAMQQVVNQAQQVAPTDTPVLITGETGTGKEILASAIHGWSSRAEHPIVSINCAALPATLIESELFGHVKGAFSGATHSRMGRFQAANGGTLFLDEVGELPLELQAKLLRALQEGCFEPVGSDRTVRVDVRILAATNVDLPAAVSAREFREDLYYRLAVFPLRLPPLRDRREDIVVIAKSFLAALAARTGRGPWSLDETSAAWLRHQPWPGNVRELVNALERASILSTSSTLQIGSPEALQAPAFLARDGQQQAPATLEQMERRHIEQTLERTDGRLYGPGGAADLLGVHPSTLRSRMKKLGLGGARTFRSSPGHRKEN